MKNLILKGSETAKRGFENEKDICNKFINWEIDKDYQKWLIIMGYVLSEIDWVKAVILHGYKTDVNVHIQIKLKNVIDTENIQVKLVSNKKGFNQVDKRWLKNYNDLWNIPKDIYILLQYFIGELKPYRKGTKDHRRMFLTEMKKEESKKIINWFSKNKILILSDIIKGRSKFSAEWILMVKKVGNSTRWSLKNVNEVLQYCSNGSIKMSPRGSINISKVNVQRKGGDSGRETANMLQFKLNPTELFDI